LEKDIMAKEVLTSEEELGFIPDVDDSEEFDFQADASVDTDEDAELGFIPDEPEELDPALIDFTVDESFKVAGDEQFDQVQFTNDVFSMPSLFAGIADPSDVQGGGLVAEQLEAEEKANRIGFTEALTTKAGRPQELLPFVGPMFSIGRMGTVMESALRIQDNPEPPKKGGTVGIIDSETGEVLTLTGVSDESPDQFAKRQVEWMRDRYIVAEWVAELNERQERGISVPGRIAEGILELPAFMVEFLTTAGVYGGAKQGTKVAIAKILKRSGEKVSKEFAKKVAKSTGIKLATKTAGVLVGTAARTTAQATRVAKSTLERLMPQIQVTKKGEVVLTESGETPFSAFAKGFGDVYIENISEISGPAIGKAASAIVKRIPFLGRFNVELQKLWLRTNPDKGVGDFIKAMGNKVGYHGFLEEIGEEQLGKALRAATGVETFGAVQTGDKIGDLVARMIAAIPSGEDLLVEAGVLAPLAALGIAGRVADVTGETFGESDILRPEQGEPVTPELLQEAGGQAVARIQLFESQKNIKLTEEQNKVALDFIDKRIGEQKSRGEKINLLAKAGGITDEEIQKIIDVTQPAEAKPPTLTEPKDVAKIDRTSDTATGEIQSQVAIVKNLPKAEQTKAEVESILKVKERISFKKPKVPVIDRLKDALLWGDKKFRDEFAVLRKAVKIVDPEGELAPADDPVQLAVAFTQKSSAKTRGFVLESTTDLAGNRKSKGLKQIFKPIVADGGKKNVENFVTYLVSARDIQLQKQNKETGIDPVASQLAFDALDSPEFAQAAREVTEWNQKGIELLVESGRITQEAGDTIKEANPIYAPFFREFGEKEIKGKVGRGKKFIPKRLKGSERKIVDPIEGMIQQMEAIINSAQRASIERSMAKLALDNPEALEDFIKPVKAPVAPTKIPIEEVKSQLEEVGVDFSGVEDADLQELLTIFRPSPGQQIGTVKLKVDGKDKLFQVEKELLDVLEGTDNYKLGPFWDFTVGKPTRLLKLGATGLNASFGMIRNPIRDVQTFTVTSEFAKGGPFSAVSGILKDVKTKASGIAENFGFDSIKPSSDVVKFSALGGEMSGFISQDRAGTKHIQHEMLASNGVRYTINTFKHPIDALRSLVGITEVGTRVGEFSAALKEGEKLYGKGSLSASVFALNAAQDVTTNFTRHGQIGKQINQIVPFFNAAIQGPDKLVRSFKDRPIKSTVAAVSTLTIPALFFWWRNKDKPWYQNMTAHEKANYIHFEHPDNEDVVIRFPVPFELGHVFQAMPVAFLDAVYNKDPKEARKILDATLKTSNPLDWPSLIGPIIDIKANEDFAGRPIVSRANEGKLPEDQFGPHTTELMKAIGKAINMSPSQLEHLTNSYSGGIYNRVNRIIQSGDTEKQPADLPIIGTLFTRDPFAPRAQVQEFYKERELLNKKFQSKKITLQEAFRRVAINNMATVLNVSFDALKESKTIEERKAIWSDIGRIVGIVDELAPKDK
jgi:hypothetical protein